MRWTGTIGCRKMTRANWTALPTALLAATLVVGEALGFAFCRFAGLWAWAALVALLIACVAAGWQIPCSLHLVAFAAGLALAWHSESKRMGVDGYAKALPEGGGPPAFVLKVEGDAVCRRDAKGRRMANFNSYLDGLPVKVVAFLPEGAAIPRDGETWRCAGWLTLRKGSACRYSTRMLWATGRQPLEMLAGSGGSSAAAAYGRMSDALSRRAGRGVEWSRELSSFCKAMILGRKEGVPRGRLALFASAGTIHVFAISGLHVMLIAGLLNRLVKGLGFSPKICAACVIALLAMYVMLIGASPSAVRAAIMASLYFGAYLFGRKPDSLSAWSAAAIIVCSVSPDMILNVGCVLSFVVMLGILLWIRWSGQYASPLDGLMRLAAIEEALGCGFRKRILLCVHRKAKLVLDAFGISFAAWIAGAPIVAMAFGKLAFGSLFVSVAVVPLAGIAVGLGVFGLAAAFLLPPIGVFFNNLAALCIYSMVWLSEKVVSLPFASVDTLPWNWMDCIMWYAAWIAFFWLLSRHLPCRTFMAVKEWEKNYDR